MCIVDLQMIIPIFFFVCVIVSFVNDFYGNYGNFLFQKLNFIWDNGDPQSTKISVLFFIINFENVSLSDNFLWKFCKRCYYVVGNA